MPIDVPYSLVALGAAAAFATVYVLTRRGGSNLWPMSPLSGRKERNLPRTPAGAAASALYDAIHEVLAESAAAAAAAAVTAAASSSETKSPLLRNNKPKALKQLAPFDPRAVAKAIAALEARSAEPDAVAAVALLRRAQEQFGKLVEGRRATAFDDDKEEDVALLRRLWSNSITAEPFERTSKLWDKLGFQGLDPTTDLRGGGMLSLDHFVSFSDAEGPALREMVAFNEAQHEAKEHSWFLTAVVSIQFSTQLCLGEIQLYPTHLAMILEDGAGVSRGMQRLHAMLLRHFFAVWKKEKPHVMEFTQFVKPKVIDTFATPSWRPSDDAWN